MNGQLNAFTAWVPGKAFIQLNAEIVDLAYMEHKDFEPVYFILAHEMGHIYLHHVQIYYTIWAVLVNFIPLLGTNILLPALSRSREYSADRVAQALTGGVGQEDCMMLLAAGRHAYKYIDTREYLRNITANHNFIERFARWCTNLVASHPITPFRVRAILDPDKKSGRLL
jgi:Zn-dependent protease with chaperone function